MKKMALQGKFNYEIIRKGVVIDKGEIKNAVTNVGLDSILDTMFNAGSQASNWYMGLITSESATALANADTMASHAGWTEDENYDEATRPEWTAGAASSQSITNSSPVVFTIDDTTSIYGFFIVSNSTKGGTTGLLFSTAAFAAERNVVDDDVINVTYTLTAARA